MNRPWILLLALMMLTTTALSSCDDGDDNSGGDGDTDSDTDTDTDTDSDTDTDTDSDSDSDGDCAAPVAAQCGGDWGVFDSGSCKCWEVPGSAAEYTWDEAVAYCENLTLGGHSDWVLASKQDYIDMLGGCDSWVLGGASGLCNTCAVVSSCTATFQQDEALFWTSTPAGESRAVYVEPKEGWINNGGKQSQTKARCVRGVK